MAKNKMTKIEIEELEMAHKQYINFLGEIQASLEAEERGFLRMMSSNDEDPRHLRPHNHDEFERRGDELCDANSKLRIFHQIKMQEDTSSMRKAGALYMRQYAEKAKQLLYDGADDEQVEKVLKLYEDDEGYQHDVYEALMY